MPRMETPNVNIGSLLVPRRRSRNKDGIPRWADGRTINSSAKSPAFNSADTKTFREAWLACSTHVEGGRRHSMLSNWLLVFLFLSVRFRSA